MKTRDIGATFLWMTPEPLEAIERAGRVCYKSEGRAGPGTAGPFVSRLIRRRHYAMLEHASMSYLLLCDRGVSHAIVRHRLFSYAQESTQYCDYAGKEIEFVRPCFGDVLNEPALGAAERAWEESCARAEADYKALRRLGCRPEDARSVLPTCLKTELAVTGNFSEWRYVFKLRLAGKGDQSQIRRVLALVRDDAAKRVPEVFGKEALE